MQSLLMMLLPLFDSQMHPIPYAEHMFYGLWSKLVHCVGTRAHTNLLSEVQLTVDCSLKH
jgi:hypothetical protein